MLQSKMQPIERKAAISLATIMSLRMLALFMVLPAFSLYAHNLIGATPLLIGLAMGIYGLTQGIFQIPFGMLSDHFGRKKIITLGFIIFAIGSLIAATSHTIWGMIIGRSLQGTGAVGSTIIALLADLTRENQRTKAMAITGATIGFSFSIAMILGPLLTAWISIPGIFWLAVILSSLAIILLFTWVPHPTANLWHADAEPEPKQLIHILLEPALARLNGGIFLLHAIFTASFVILPISLQNLAGLHGNEQWLLYLPTLLLAFILSIPCIIIAEKKHSLKTFFLAAIVILGIAELLLWFFAHSLLISALSLLLFFTAFSILEAFLPSLVSKTAPPQRKGTALGIYSCSQFLGIFIGGTLGGWLYGAFGLTDVYLFCVILTGLWFAIAFGMKKPQYPR
jgi:MFS family permease